MSVFFDSSSSETGISFVFLVIIKSPLTTFFKISTSEVPQLCATRAKDIPNHIKIKVPNTNFLFSLRYSNYIRTYMYERIIQIICFINLLIQFCNFIKLSLSLKFSSILLFYLFLSFLFVVSIGFFIVLLVFVVVVKTKSGFVCESKLGDCF